MSNIFELAPSPAHAAAYRDWLLAPLCEAVIATIRSRVAAQRALGDEASTRMIEQTLNRPVDFRVRGRPKLEE